MIFSSATLTCFNTQPPEGGWVNDTKPKFRMKKFQHTAARRRLVSEVPNFIGSVAVSTHSRPKAAGWR